MNDFYDLIYNEPPMSTKSTQVLTIEVGTKTNIKMFYQFAKIVRFYEQRNTIV